MAIQKIVTDDALSAFASDVKAAIANVSSPLVYKGTLGTGGTISTLPAASASNNGFAYVVITAGTYQGVVCAVGDVIASNGTAWNIIPQANSAETLPITTGSAVNTKEYIDDKTTLVKSASGSLIHITDGGDNIPLKTCEITIAPDLTGHTEANLVVCGKNLLPSYNLSGSGTLTINSNNGVYSITGTASAYMNVIASDSFFLKSGTYTLNNINSGTSDIRAQLRSVDGQTIYATSGTVSNTFTLNETTEVKFRFAINVGTYNETCKPELEIGNEANTFNQYNGTTYNIPFGQTVYGGSGNLISGEFVKTWGHQVYDGSVDENWIVETTPAGINFYIPVSDAQRPCYSNNIIINGYESCPSPVSHSDKGFISNGGNFNITIGNTLGIDNVNDFKTWLSNNNLIITYKLATPTALSLTPVTPKTISGVNNIYNDCGDTDIEYFTSSADGLAALIEVLSNS